MKNKRFFLKTISYYVFLLSALLAVSACEKKMAVASIVGYNHTKDRFIYTFTVNGAMGSNLRPEGGGGGETCCISIPKTWRPGLKAEIAWVYDTAQDDPNPPPPSQKIEVPIPEYKKPGRFQVHFYDNNKVKIVISTCSIGHPFYPMSEKDKLPWRTSYSKEEAIESYKNGGLPYDC